MFTAVALGQLERLDELVAYRVAAACASPPCSCLHSNDSELINPSHSNVESRLSTRGLSSQSAIGCSLPLCATRTYATLCIQPRPAVESLSRALSALLYRLTHPFCPMHTLRYLVQLVPGTVESESCGLTALIATVAGRSLTRRWRGFPSSSLKRPPPARLTPTGPIRSSWRLRGRRRIGSSSVRAAALNPCVRIFVK